MAFGRLGSGGTGFGRLGSTGSGGGVAAAVGGGALLTGEANGFAADFTYATDASRVAVKTAGTVVSSGTSFFTNVGVSSKWVFNAAGTLVNVAAGQLAIDYDPVTHAAKGLLCEPAATNVAIQSQTFDAWSPSSVTVVANQAVAPNGTTTMDKVYPASSGSNRWVSNPITSSAVVYTYSVYAKAAGKRWMYFLKFDGSNFGAWFDLQNGVVGNKDAAFTSSSMQDVGNGIYRCMVTGMGNVALNNAIGLCDANGSGSVTVSGTDGVYLWGAQIETGTVATSYIPTVAATVTRAADVVRITPASINYSGTAGSWWFDLSVNAFGAAGQDRIVGYTTGSNTPIHISSGTAFTLYDGVAYFSRTVASVLGSHKVAAAFASADRAITADGLAVATNTAVGTALLSPGANIAFGNGISGSEPANLYIRKLRYVPRRKSNAELVTETT